MAKKYRLVYKGWALGAGQEKGRAYAIQLREDGTRGSRVSLGVSLEPTEAARSALIAFADGVDRHEATADPLLGYIMDKYLDKLTAEKRSGVRAARVNLARAREFFGHLRVSSLSTELCQRYAIQQDGKVLPGGAKAYSRNTIYNDLNTMRSAVRWARHSGDLFREEHHKRMWLPTRPPGRNRVMTPDEVFALVDAAAPHIRLFIWLCLLTAQRHMAVVGLRWDQVDLERGTIDFRLEVKERSITDKGYSKGRAVVKIAPELMAALVAAKAVAKTDWVIEYQGRRPAYGCQGGFTAARKAAGLGADVVPHVLRHTAITWGANSGVTVEAMMKMSGHRERGTLERVYWHEDADASAQAVEAVSRKLATAGKGIRRVK